MATGFEPAPGYDDLTAQTKDAEEAELAQALAEVRRRRAETETAAVSVIDPDGSAYEVDSKTGAVLLDEEGTPVPKWPYQTVTIRGRAIQIRAPKATALTAFALVNAKGVPIEKQNAAMAQLMRKHVSAKSFEELQEAMMDPDDEFTMEDFQQLVKEIAQLSTARPTGPSQP